MYKQSKKIIFTSVLTASLLLVTLGTSNADSKQKVLFKDTKNHWAQSVIERYASMGIIKGLGNGTFKPDLKITRTQFFAMLHRGLDIQNRYFAAPDITKIYKDTKNEDWYATLVYDLHTNGIIDDKDFLRGNELITREEMAHYAVNAFKNAKGEEIGKTDNDAIEVRDINQSTKRYVEDIYFAYGVKIVSGKPGGIFDPKGLSTRAEGLFVVNNLLEAIGYNNIESLKIEPSYTIDSNGLNMTLKVVNQGSKPLILEHTSGQKYDFELLDADKKSIYKWSDGKMFTQMLENTNISKANSLEFSEMLSYKGNEGIIESSRYLVCYLKGSIESQSISTSGYMLELIKNPAQMPDLTGEREPVLMDENIYKVVCNGNTAYLGQWDNKVDLSTIFGAQTSEKLEILPSTADTFAGSFIKKISYDGAQVELFSPKSNGKTFWIMKVVLSDSKYEVGYKIKVGDLIDRLLSDTSINDISMVQDGRTDKNNCAYIIQNPNDMTSIVCEVANGFIKSITLEKLLM